MHDPGTQVEWIQFAPGFATNRTVFLNAGGVLFRSTDAGDTWQDLTWVAGLGYSIREEVISPRYAFDHTLWLWEQYPTWHSDRPAGSYRSRDGGVTWAQLPVPEMLAVQEAAEIGNTDGSAGVLLFGRYYSADFQTYLYKSLDYGETWQCLGPSPLLVWLPMVFQK